TMSYADVRFGINADSNQEITLYTIAPNTPAQKPPTWNPGMKDPTAQNNSPLITKMNKPSVRIVTGNVSRTRSGRISVLIRPSTTATINAVVNESTVIVVKRYGSASNASAFASQ